MKQYDIAAYIWPSYTGKEPRARQFWEQGIGEWQSVLSAEKRTEDQILPRKPLWGTVDEADPAVMEFQIKEALRHGVNVFIYDWYWYDRRPFLEQCLDEGFLGAKNNTDMQFYLMWANHDAVYTWDKALEYAVKMDLIPYNVSDRVELPKVEKYVPEYFKESEILDFLEKTKDHKLALLFQIAIFYGMRKEEIVGLTWDEIDFDNNCFTIGNTVKKVTIDGKRELIIERKTKNRSSYRTMPLNPVIKEKLLILKKKQEENKKICGDCYDYTYNGYVFVDPMGVLYDPDYVYSAFKKVLEQYGFKNIRFHDLRHSCASLMVTKGDGINNVQKWLGHSDIGTTANIYAHLDYQSKVESAEKMSGILPIPENIQRTDW